MNKQELIKEYESIVEDDSLELCGCYNMADKVFMRKIYKSVLEDLKQLDKPQKVTVPQFVADWYEENKNNLDKNIYDCIVGWGIHSNDEREWMRETKPFQTLVNMHQFGYTVEKEKRYLVTVKNIGDGWEYLKWNSVQQYWYFGNKEKLDGVRLYHTLENLQKGGFGSGIFVNPLFTIEEVTE
ncbi:DUF1642 domain-containing protein [Streptococcus sp.]